MRHPVARALGGPARDERGVALVEALLVVAVTAILALPMLAWMITGLRAGAASEDRSVVTAARNQVTTYFARDGASAESVVVAGADCAGGRSGGGSVIVTMARPSESTSIVYVALGDAGGAVEIWRRRCDGADLVDETPLTAGAVAPAGGWAAAATCVAGDGDPADPCASVTLDVPLAGGEHVRTTAYRRIGGPR